MACFTRLGRSQVSKHPFARAMRSWRLHGGWRQVALDSALGRRRGFASKLEAGKILPPRSPERLDALHGAMVSLAADAGGAAPTLAQFHESVARDRIARDPILAAFVARGSIGELRDEVGALLDDCVQAREIVGALLSYAAAPSGALPIRYRGGQS